MYVLSTNTDILTNTLKYRYVAHFPPPPNIFMVVGKIRKIVTNIQREISVVNVNLYVETIFFKHLRKLSRPCKVKITLII